MNEMFKLDEFENETIVESADIGNDSIDDDIDENINESGNNEIPEKPTAKLEGDTTNQLPGGEQPATRPKDETKIMTGGGTEIKADVYNSAMDALKKSFKEATELIDMLTNCTIVEKSIAELQAEFTENAILESYDNGPYFEKVDRADKDEVKEITKNIRTKVGKYVRDEGYKFIPRKVVDVWAAYMWQTLGLVYIEAANVTKLCDDLNEEFKEELGEYKIIPVACIAGLIDAVRVKFNWKNTFGVFALLIDKKMNSELKKLDKQGKADQKELIKEAEKKEEK